ncbi:serine hydrolase [Myroides marinus]|uniref:Serine hydrolase n=1 Tax=Myroides marinus TaxID=703342 RepID=A0A161S2Z6_9FLAO|nr:serine hydrolase [Myroides marinus]KZE78769.1 serine hydrolase [Myroides marinus]MDM1350204.1 serine hydrolase [Myroides marinus]MDM1357411.1 serine hydrolase [Myroides marinus]MDM1364802.1 serine hydrolase [Myroides marinus]MDM1369994.1 serine hydrolase [Myroides marinus]
MKQLFILTSLFTLLWSSSTYSQDLHTKIDSIRNLYNVPEVTYAIITKDQIIKQGASGHHKFNEKNNTSNASIQDYFHLGSNTKAITGFIAAKLVEQGKITWETTFFDLFPETKKGANPIYHNATLKDYFSHRAKVHAFTSGTERLSLPVFEGNKQQQRQAFAKHVLTLAPIESPDGYTYSNAGYSIAATMLEKVSNKSWEELTKEFLTKDLGIEFVIGWPNRNLDNQPWGHALQYDVLESVPPTYNYQLSLIEPAGDLSMNIENYIKYIQLNLKGLSGQSNTLSAKTYDFLFNSREKYAIGWGNLTTKEMKLYDHAGSDGTFFSYTQIDGLTNTAYIILANSGTTNAQQAVMKIVQEMKDSMK